jgi:2-methylcitrate dehydratase PrpD
MLWQDSRSTTMTVARQIADFLADTSVADLPPRALDYAAMLIASTIASAAFGRQIGSARIIRDLARERGGREEASAWFDAGTRLPVADAAQVNAVMSDAAASDDSDLRNIIHPGTPLTAVSLAMAERNGSDGEAVLAAIVCGYEAAGRIGDAITPGFRERGFHGCFGAVFAASVAAARLLRLDAARMAQAIALSATSIGGLAVAANTSVAREYHAGLAAMLGVNVAIRVRKACWKRGAGSSRHSAASIARQGPRSRHAGSARAGISAPTWRSSWCPADIRITHSPRRPRMPRVTGMSSRRRSKA